MHILPASYKDARYATLITFMCRPMLCICMHVITRLSTVDFLIRVAIYDRVYPDPSFIMGLFAIICGVRADV